MKLSIGIPTRERASCLKFSLETALNIDSDNVEIVVSDNASDDGTKDLVHSFSDPRLKYVNTGKRVSMRENFENTVNHCTGDYIFTMGDDDGIVSKQISNVLPLIERYQPDILYWHVPQFIWRPDGVSPNKNTLRIRKSYVFGQPEILNVDRFRTDLLACRQKKLRPLPAQYHGFASRNYLNKLRSKNGILFNSSIPDYYISYLAILHGGRFLNANHVFSINGASPMSTGGDMSSSTKSDEDGAPGEKYRHEVEQDVVSEPFDTSLSVPMALFGALESARANLSGSPHEPDYVAWYSHILHSTEGMNLETQKATDVELRNYARKTGTEASLAAATPSLAAGQRSFDRLLKKLLENLSLETLCKGSDPKKNIATAIYQLDGFLGQDYAAVLDGQIGHSQAWRNAKHRAARSRSE